MVDRYKENSDITSIIYKKYNQEPENKYPTFSICFTGTRYHWYHESQIFRDYGLDPVSYGVMLMGETAMTYEYNYTSRLYHKLPVPMNKDMNENMDQYHLRPSDILLRSEFVNERCYK